jgi:hypothetical protein
MVFQIRLGPVPADAGCQILQLLRASAIGSSDEFKLSIVEERHLSLAAEAVLQLHGSR